MSALAYCLTLGTGGEATPRRPTHQPLTMQRCSVPMT